MTSHSFHTYRQPFKDFFAVCPCILLSQPTIITGGTSDANKNFTDVDKPRRHGTGNRLCEKNHLTQPQKSNLFITHNVKSDKMSAAKTAFLP